VTRAELVEVLTAERYTPRSDTSTERRARMAWFKVDDNLTFHPKAVMAGNAALGMWVRAGSWAAQQLTDGYVPLDMARSLGTTRQARSLTDSGLWIPCGNGYEFHQWTERQPLRKDVEAKRAAGAERLRRWREEHSD
jgi:hypothetical protein